MTLPLASESARSSSGPHDEVARVLAATRQQLLPALQAAIADEAAAQARRLELEKSLEGLALDFAMISGGASVANVEGTPIDLDAMRAYVIQLSQESARATTLRHNIAVLVELLGNHQQHFGSGQVFVTAVDSVDDRLHAAMVSAREEERRRLAREIHDGPAQVLTNAIYAIQIVEQVAKRTPKQVGEELSKVRDLLKDGVTEVRRFMFDLRPTMLQDQGLVPTFRRYVEDYGRFFGKTVHLEIGPDLPPLTPDQDLNVFRILQEALQNIHKHAGVTATAWVSLHRAGDRLTLEIRDDGPGFDPALATALHGSGSGLPGIRDRAELAGGTLEIESTVGEGTTVRLHLEVDDDPPPGAAGVLAFA